MAINPSAGWPQVHETLSDSFDENWNVPMRNPNGEKIELNWGGLYPAFEAKDSTSPVQDPEDRRSLGEDENLEVENNITEKWIYSPFVNRLMKDGFIQYEIAENLKTELVKNPDHKTVVKNSDMTASKKKAITGMLENMAHPEYQKKFQERFAKDHAAELKVFQNPEWEFNSQRAQTAFEMVWSYYITFWENPSKNAKSNALHMAIQTASNQAIEGMILSTNTERFKQDFRIINDSDASFEKRFTALIDLMEYAWLDQWKKWNKSKEMLMRQKSLKNAWLEKKYRNAENTKRLAEQQWNAEAVRQQEIVMQNIIDSIPEVSQGEVMKWWELDTFAELSETAKKIA